MRNRVVIVISVALMLVLLGVLNAASYVRLERQADSEFFPDRSTLNPGATGTRALHDFLKESGHAVVRWRKAPAALLDEREAVRPRTFVVVGDLRYEFEKEEARALLGWVSRGGRLVVVDRSPDPALLPASGGWRVTAEIVDTPGVEVRAGDAAAMLAGMEPVAPAQATLLTRDVERAAPSRFASRLVVSAPLDDASGGTDAGGGIGGAHDEPDAGGETDEGGTAEEETTAGEEGGDERRGQARSPAPVVHLARDRTSGGALLVDHAYGRGRVLVLSDPFVVSNGGLAQADNLQLAVNLLTGGGGLVAFDEFHQGRTESENMALAYFRGTPVVSMLAQLGVVALAVLWTRSRRFARPLPSPRADRRSKLEFVASMAELQQRARAHDLAVENVYSRTRRALARYGGADANASAADIAARVAQRTGRDTRELAALMRECEESIAGRPVPARRAVELVAGLRRWERELGIRLRSREIRQRRAL